MPSNHHSWHHHIRWFYLKLTQNFRLWLRLKLITALTQANIPWQRVEIFCTEIRFSYSACPHIWLLYIQRDKVIDLDCSAKPFLLVQLETCSRYAHTPCIPKRHAVMCLTSSCNLHALHNILVYIDFLV